MNACQAKFGKFLKGTMFLQINLDTPVGLDDASRGRLKSFGVSQRETNKLPSGSFVGKEFTKLYPIEELIQLIFG